MGNRNATGSLVRLLQERSKKEILDMARWRCSHGHSGLSHVNCYVKEHGIEEKLGFIDIEFMNLAANYGVMICWCMGLEPEGTIIGDLITPKELQGKDKDRNVVQSCINTMRTRDRLIGHYSGDRRCDIPYLRTRALKHGLDFPEYGEIYHTDVYTIARGKLRLNSNRQNVITELIKGDSLKTRITDDWIDAITSGDKKALRSIYDHCERDIKDLMDNYYALIPYVRQTRSSL